MSLGTNLRRLRGDKGLTQWALAQKTGIKVGHISKLESDASDPKLSTIYKLMEAFQCSADSLLMDKSKVGIDSILKATLERAMTLPEQNKRIIIDVVDKYCIACGLEQTFAGPKKPWLRVMTDAPESALPDGETSPEAAPKTAGKGA
jgi:transcriptional regulator with XRE-family HTH domain